MKCVKITVQHDGNNKVAAIKAWRTVTGQSLKEAKDFIDPIFGQGYHARVVVVLNMAQYGELMFSKEDRLESGLMVSSAVRYEKDAVIDFSNVTQ